MSDLITSSTVCWHQCVYVCSCMRQCACVCESSKIATFVICGFSIFSCVCVCDNDYLLLPVKLVCLCVRVCVCVCAGMRSQSSVCLSQPWCCCVSTSPRR